MTLDDIKFMIAGRLGQRTDIDNMIYSEIRQAQRTLETTPPYPWFLDFAYAYEFSAHINDLPDRFIEMSQDFIWVSKATGDPEPAGPPSKIYGGYFEHTRTMSLSVLGRPKNFTIHSNNLYFQPAPDKSYTFGLLYYRKEDPLSTPASENQWTNRASDLLIAEAGWHVARNIRDAEAATLFGQDRAEARRRIAQETTSRLESMRRAVIGSGEDALLGYQTEVGRP